MLGRWANDQVDHKDGNRTNNTWKNLREATHLQNYWNRRARTTFKGATFLARQNLWQSRIVINGQRILIALLQDATSRPSRVHKQSESGIWSIRNTMEMSVPWATPTLAEVRGMVRDAIRAKLPGADALIPNSVLRVLSDNQGAQCHTVLQYVDWLALQLLPDSAETEFLDRHGDIWLVNADGTTGRKMATLAEGVVTITSDVGGIIVPVGTRMSATVATAIGGVTIEYETLEGIITSFDPTVAVPCRTRSLDPGAASNLVRAIRWR